MHYIVYTPRPKHYEKFYGSIGHFLLGLYQSNHFAFSPLIFCILCEKVKKNLNVLSHA